MNKSLTKQPTGARVGRRPGKPATRDAILEVARARFMSGGYEQVTLRGIAAEAKVDPALISYFFGSKRDLFGEAMALPVNPARVLSDLLDQGLDDLAARILTRLIHVWDDPASGDPLLALARSAASEERAADLMREFVERELIEPIAAHLTGASPRLRAGALASNLLGIIHARYVLRVEPLASADPASVVTTLAPALDRLINPPTRPRRRPA